MISVIVATYQRQASLQLTLTWLSRQTFTDFEVIVVDDGGTDESGTVAKSFSCTYIWHPHNGFGLSKSRNQGASVARGNIFLFIDSDIMLAPKSLATLQQLYEENPDRAIGGYYKYLPGMEITANDSWDDIWNYRLPEKDIVQRGKPVGLDVRDAWRRLDEQNHNFLREDVFEYEHKVCWAPMCLLGGVMAIPRHIFEQTDGFDESFNTYGGEDAEMSLAIISRGYGISYCRSIAGAHIAHEVDADADWEIEKQKRAVIAKKYPAFFTKDGDPDYEVWGKPVSRC